MIELTATFSVEQIFELIALVGFYHTVAFFERATVAEPVIPAARRG